MCVDSLAASSDEAVDSLPDEVVTLIAEFHLVTDDGILGMHTTPPSILMGGERLDRAAETFWRVNRACRRAAMSLDRRLVALGYATPIAFAQATLADADRANGIQWLIAIRAHDRWLLGARMAALSLALPRLGALRALEVDLRAEALHDRPLLRAIGQLPALRTLSLSVHSSDMNSGDAGDESEGCLDLVGLALACGAGGRDGISGLRSLEVHGAWVEVYVGRSAGQGVAFPAMGRLRCLLINGMHATAAEDVLRCIGKTADGLRLLDVVNLSVEDAAAATLQRLLEAVPRSIRALRLVFDDDVSDTVDVENDVPLWTLISDLPHLHALSLGNVPLLPFHRVAHLPPTLQQFDYMEPNQIRTPALALALVQFAARVLKPATFYLQRGHPLTSRSAALEQCQDDDAMLLVRELSRRVR